MNTKFLHYRAVDESAKTTLNPKGVISRTGATIAYRQDEGKPIYYAGAFCHPYDNFNKHLGRAKAGGRLESPRYREDTDLTDRTEFIQRMDSEMAEHGYVRLERIPLELKQLKKKHGVK